MSYEYNKSHEDHESYEYVIAIANCQKFEPMSNDRKGKTLR